MPCPLCRHLKTDGRVCQSPALRGRAWCYFHAPLHGISRLKRAARSIQPPNTLPLPSLDSPESIRAAIALVVAAIAAGKLDNVRAAQLLSGLQLAAQLSHRPAYRAAIV